MTPNRELVIQWDNMPRVVSTKSGITPSAQGVTFQLVFFENSSDILFNYQDLVFGSSTANGAASATIGVQFKYFIPFDKVGMLVSIKR